MRYLVIVWLFIFIVGVTNGYTYSGENMKKLLSYNKKQIQAMEDMIDTYDQKGTEWFVFLNTDGLIVCMPMHLSEYLDYELKYRNIVKQIKQGESNE